MNMRVLWSHPLAGFRNVESRCRLGSRKPYLARDVPSCLRSLDGWRACYCPRLWLSGFRVYTFRRPYRRCAAPVHALQAFDTI